MRTEGGLRYSGTPRLLKMAAAACSFSGFFAFVGWYDTTGGRGWKGFAIPVLTAFAGQGLAFPGWTWRIGLRLAIAGLGVGAALSVLIVIAFVVPPLFVVIPGLPVGAAYGWACHRVDRGLWGGLIGFSPLLLIPLGNLFHDAADASLFPAPGVPSLAIYGAVGGAILGAFLSTGPSRVSEADEAGALA
jgi:hypothetical protein